MHIKVEELVGKNALTPEDGKLVYEAVRPGLELGETVELDFAGVEVFASPFFNWGIARLVADFDAEKLNTMLCFNHLSAPGDQALRRAIENAKEYFSITESERQAIDDKVHQAVAQL